jgi:hypothetical protein
MNRVNLTVFSDLARCSASTRGAIKSICYGSFRIPVREDFALSPVQRLLERAQEVDDVLPLFHAQSIEGLDGLICLAITVVLNRLDEVGCSPVVQEKDTLPNTPG